MSTHNTKDFKLYEDSALIDNIYDICNTIGIQSQTIGTTGPTGPMAMGSVSLL